MNIEKFIKNNRESILGSCVDLILALDHDEFDPKKRVDSNGVTAQLIKFNFNEGYCTFLIDVNIDFFEINNYEVRFFFKEINEKATQKTGKVFYIENRALFLTFLTSGE